MVLYSYKWDYYRFKNGNYSDSWTQENPGFDPLVMNFRVCKVENRHVEWENHRTKWTISHRVNDLGYLGAWNAWGNPAKWCPVCQFSWWKLSKLAIGFVVDIPLESFRHHGYGILPQKRSDTFGRSNYLLISWWLWHTFFFSVSKIGHELAMNGWGVKQEDMGCWPSTVPEFLSSVDVSRFQDDGRLDHHQQILDVRRGWKLHHLDRWFPQLDFLTSFLQLVWGFSSLPYLIRPEGRSKKI